jgi:hypothetical protein
MARQGKDSADKESVVTRFEQVADVIEGRWPGPAMRLPSPREAVVVVEIPLATLEKIVEVATNPRHVRQHMIGVEPPSSRKPYPNLRAMLTHGRYYSFDSAQQELQAVIDFVDGKR